MDDYLVRAMTSDGKVRALACVTTNLVDEACQGHGTYPTASAALGRALTGGLLLSALLDPEQRVALKFAGDGPLQKIVVEAESGGVVRGYVKVPQVDLPPKRGKLDVSGALGKAGFLTVTKDLRVKDLYHSMVKLYTGEIASDIAYYLTESEQIPSAVGLGVYVGPDSRVTAAGGFLIQAMPPSDESMIEALIDHIEHMPSITDQLRQGRTPEGLLAAIMNGIDYTLLETQPLAYRCSCSRGRIEQALITLGQEEVLSIIQQDQIIDVKCEFCRKTYVFERRALERLLGEMH
ncbi:MAG: Hsp33 family molecular chaperone HslO [Syntrophaceae bacterium]